VLNAPNFANGCVCSYSIFTSLAFVHVPTNEKWAYSAYKAPKGRIASVGINFGAPGDRTAESGTLWLDYPNVGGPSPAVSVRTVPDRPAKFRRHSEQVRGEGPAWVQASGFEGLESVTISLGKDQGKPAEGAYTVRLFFCDSESDAPGKRVFDVGLQGKVVLRGLDVRKVAGEKGVGVVREVRDVVIKEALTLELEAVAGETLLSGVEIRAQ